MTPPPVSFTPRITLLLAGLTFLVGFTVLIGWQFDLETLKRIQPGLVAMNPMTAVGFLLLACSLILNVQGHFQVARLLSLLVFLLGFTKVLSVLLDFDASVDHWLYADRLIDPGSETPNRMAPNTGLNFLLLGLALLLYTPQKKGLHLPTQVLADSSFLLSMVPLMGYLYNIQDFYTVGEFIPMALHTALTFLCASVGVLSLQKHYGVIGLMRQKTLGGLLARYMLPTILLVPVLLGVLQLYGERQGWFDVLHGNALRIVASMLVYALLVFFLARTIHRTDKSRLQATLGLEAREERYRAVTEMAADAIITMNEQGEVVGFNHSAERVFGYAREEVLGENLSLLMPERYREAHEKGLQRYLQSREPRVIGQTVELEGLRKDGSEFPMELALSTWTIESGTYFTGAVRDITERKRAEQARKRAEGYSQAQARISKLLEENLSPLEMAREASQIVAEAAGLDYTGLMTVEGDTGQVSTVFLADHASPAFRQAIEQPVPRGRGMSWKSLEEGRPFFVEDHLQQPGANPIFVQAGVSAVAYFPVVPLTGSVSDPMVFVACWLNGNTRWGEEDRNLLESAARTLKVAAEREEHLKTLEQAALFDALTGLGNRRAFEQDLKAEHARAKRHNQPLGLMVLDLDGLKTINDFQGHEAGDRLLRTFGQHLKGTMRLEDRCYRLGGDEFAVILSHAPLASSPVLYERMEGMMEEVRKAGFQKAGVSVGMAYFPQERSTVEDLLRLADERMYLMKAQHHLERE